MLQNLLFSMSIFYVNIDQSIHKVKFKVALNEKQKKTTWVFFFHEHSKFWSISLEDYHKPFISQEWPLKYFFCYCIIVWCQQYMKRKFKNIHTIYLQCNFHFFSSSISNHKVSKWPLWCFGDKKWNLLHIVSFSGVRLGHFYQI